MSHDNAFLCHGEASANRVKVNQRLFIVQIKNDNYEIEILANSTSLVSSMTPISIIYFNFF